MNKTKIEWADITINPVVGCSHCSPGCDNCYAERFAARLAKNPKTAAKYAGVVDDGRWTGKISSADFSMFKSLPKAPKRVFVGSMTDIFHDATGGKFHDIENRKKSNYFLPKLFDIMESLSQYTFIILTKRPENMRQWIEFTLEACVDDILPNLWLGVTVCNQAEADEKIPVLLQTPAALRFVSVEPMLGPVNFRLEDLVGQTWDTLRGVITAESAGLGIVTGCQQTSRLGWVICGGETGPGARPMHPEWIRGLRDQCAAAGASFFFEGWGEWAPRSNHPLHNYGVSACAVDPQCTRWDCIRLTEKGNNGNLLEHSGEGEEVYMQKVGKRRSGRLLDGIEYSQFPEVKI